MIIGDICYKLYGFNRKKITNFVLYLVKKFEGGELYSPTLRKIFNDYHKVKIGEYTMGGCFVPGQIDKFTEIGRYCSFAGQIRTLNRDHAVEFKSSHAFFYNPRLGYCEKDFVDYQPLTIGNDVWIGHNAVITSSVSVIGHGAVIGANSVVAKNIPPYAVVVGNPGRVVRYRFPDEIIGHLLETKWWEKSIDEIVQNIPEYTQPYTNYYFQNIKKLIG